ncbi:MAG: radical SAM protein, partial [Candidatus Omnitrophica bacterium]|nr:radical SAM protein [Candidatus Omnitrophota bacterium]
MFKLAYKNFSLATHIKSISLKKIIFAQFDLTYKCDYSCNYCYTICFNKEKYLKKELDTNKIKAILDKLYNEGILWLTFSGGDPLTRSDFLEIYKYSKEKGFLISILTNGYRIDLKLIDFFKKYRPFLIEITLNSINPKTFKKIIQKNLNSEKVLSVIKKLKKEGLPLKIKTQVIKNNLDEIPKIKKFLQKLNLKFYPSSIIYPRLNKNKFPCSLRIDKEKFFKKNLGCNQNFKKHFKFFPCTVLNTEGIQIDPYGNVFLCELIRKPKVNILRCDLKTLYNKLIDFLKDLENRYKDKCLCARCRYIYSCMWCPGKAYLETNSFIKPIDYYCLQKEILNYGKSI